jgi:hypothetical protein
MSGRELSHYTATVTAGPGHPEVILDVAYYDRVGDVIGQHGVTMIAFCATWKDIATVIREGLQKLQLDNDPVSNVSPMVDLS